jgi:S1-C subfamily serine protease
MSKRLGAEGAVIRDVQPGSPADRAGLGGLRMERSGRARLGDVIVSIDGAPVRDPNDLLKALDSRDVGDTIVVGVTRDGATREVRIALAALE